MNDVRFSMKKHSEKENLKTEMLLALMRLQNDHDADYFTVKGSRETSQSIKEPTRPQNHRQRTPEKANAKMHGKAFELEKHVIGICLKARNFSHLFVNGVRFSMKKQFSKENLKTGMLLGSSFFSKKKHA